MSNQSNNLNNLNNSNNLTNFYDASELRTNHHKLKKVFFYRISGMGMGTTATLLREAGYEVAGCDMAFYPPMGDYLKKHQITCYTMDEITESILKQFDLIVVGNSISGKSAEAKLIENCGVPFTSFPCLLGEIVLKDRTVVGIAGTHGKTTTTYYLTQMLSNLGEDVGYLVGGVLKDRDASKLGTSKYFVIEADEYESSYFQKFSKLRLYNIKKLVLAALEFDHADVFKTIAEIEKQFDVIIPNLSGLVVNSDYEAAQRFTEKVKTLQKINIFSYGLKSPNGPIDIVTKNGKTTFSIMVNNAKTAFETNIIGPQNILNLAACIYFCLQEGFAIEKIKKSLEQLHNVKRRQELKGTYGKCKVVDDFAHHPTAIELTLESIRQTYPNQSIHVVFEAVTSTARSNAFQDEFARVFENVASVLIANPQIPTNASQYENLNYSKLASDINSQGVFSREYLELESLRKEIDKLAQNEGVLLILSNRTVLGLWESDFVKKIV